MEALALLKFWRTAAARADVSSEGDDVRNAAFATDDDDSDEDSFFDLDFKSPERGGAVEERDGGDSKKDFQFIESPRDVLLTINDNFSNSKPLSPVTILRSAPKFKVFMLGFRKSSKCSKAEPTNGETKADPANQLSKSLKLDRSNRFSANCRVAAEAPVFTRDNSLRSKMMREKSFDYETASDAGSTERSVPRYLKLIKPFYAKASSKVKSTDSVTPSSSPVTAAVNLSPRKFSEGSRIGSFKIVARNLGKSRSASSAATVGVAPPSIRRRDDSLLEQNDGIQGAILHCKKSLNSSSQDYSRLFPLRNSFEEQKRCSI